MVLLNHPPKVIKGRLGDRRLGDDDPLAQKVNKVSIYIVLDAVLILPKVDPSGLERHVLSVAIKFVLFWIFV